MGKTSTNRLTPRTSWLHPDLFIFGHLIVFTGTDSHPQLKPKAKSHSPTFPQLSSNPSGFKQFYIFLSFCH